MKKTAVALAVLLLLLAGTISASALELKADKIRPFGDNILTVTSDDGGMLTIEAFSGTIPLENPATDMRIEPGSVDIPWQALTYGGEPISQGSLTLRATLTGADRTTEQTEITVETGTPVPAVVCCLPAAQSFHANGKNILKVEVAVSAGGVCEITAAPKEQPDETVWRVRKQLSGKEPEVLRWDGKNLKHKICQPGEYVITAKSVLCPEQVSTATVTLLEEPLPAPELTVTGSLIPSDFSDDAEVWKALTEPVVIGDGPEGQGLRIMNAKSAWEGCAGTVSCRTVGLSVLQIDTDGWVKVGAWTQAAGYYTEGYVRADKLRVIRPNDRYGAVLDKKNQTLTIYERGKKLGTVTVSTGRTTAENRQADTHSGVYLLGTRMENFVTEGHTYCYPIRIDGYNLIHQMGYVKVNGTRNFDEELALLGTKASHGCIRVDARISEENSGLNAWWIWTHLGHDTKIIITPEE